MNGQGRRKWRLRYNGKPIGRTFERETEAKDALFRLQRCMLGLSYGEVSV